MNALDIVIISIVMLGGLNGLRQGFIKAFANLVGWVVALVLAARYAAALAPMMSGLSLDPVIQKIAAFAFIVMLIVVATWLFGAFLNSAFKSLKLGPLNRLVGGGFGSFKGLMIVLITMQGVGSWVDSSPHWRQSKLVQSLMPFAPLATEISKNAAHQVYTEMQAPNSFKTPETNRPVQQKNNAEQNSNQTQNPFY
ncbi:CvpA family protein [Acinetobacter larvae]|uniref:Colicin V synthesis protein n=1 Tax=Acinetobacter larvae TaxID=1789224 RepID=A0A1B2LYP5_9GAMM|nr:CvpA family protein [Acinetobacter larvae]AOA58078.1 colicin V synthesis protein [Acinetobacter larvae]